MFLVEFVSLFSYEKYVDSGGGVMNNILQFYYYYNFVCKQEISVDDYNVYVYDFFVENFYYF